jgi:cytochrome c-type biogenesis protein CcmH
MPVYAQEPSADDINEIAEKLSCPTCTGISVADCPTETCVQWRAQIGQMMTEGKNEGEILDYFSARYGDHVLQVPPKRGFFVWVWLLPALTILAGLAWLAYLMRGWTQRRAALRVRSPMDEGQAAPSETVEDEYLRRVRQDLEKLS